MLTIVAPAYMLPKLLLVFQGSTKFDKTVKVSKLLMSCILDTQHLERNPVSAPSEETAES